jgi:hypothetical protein
MVEYQIVALKVMGSNPIIRQDEMITLQYFSLEFSSEKYCNVIIYIRLKRDLNSFIKICNLIHHRKCFSIKMKKIGFEPM